MRLNKKQKLFIFLSVLLVTIGGAYPLYYLNRPKNLNVLLITIDAVRPDHLGCYGYGRNTSPYIDKIAKEGVMFTRAISQGSWTLPSISSLLTSTYPSIHNITDYGKSLNTSISTLSGILKDKGYPVGFIGPPVISTIHNFNRDFDLFEVSEEYEKADKITHLAIEWIKKNQNHSFFLWLHYFDPHGPYCLPAPYNKIFLNDKITKRNKNLPIINLYYLGLGGIPEYVIEDRISDMEYYISQYDGEIRFVDEMLGILIAELKKLNLYRNTIIIITADHGEYLGEHNVFFSHGFPSFLEPVIKVPLITNYSRVFPKNKKISHQVRLIDIAPTILDILKIKKPKSMQGTSLLCMLRENPPILYSFFKTEFASCIRTQDWKLIHIDFDYEKTSKAFYHKDGSKKIPLNFLCEFMFKEKKPPEYQLFNLVHDPQEMNNLAEKEKGKFNELKEKLDNWVSWIEKQLTDSSEESRPLNEKMKEKLKSLGYTN